MQCCVFSPPVSQEKKRAKETEIGQLRSVAIQVLFGSRFGFSERVVYFHTVLKYSHIFFLRKSQIERKKKKSLPIFVMILRSPVTFFQTSDFARKT